MKKKLLVAQEARPAFVVDASAAAKWHLTEVTADTKLSGRIRSSPEVIWIADYLP